MWLLKRELARGAAPAVLEAYQCTDFDGTTLNATPAWGGAYAVDVVACVAEPAGGTFWLKALNRSVQVNNTLLEPIMLYPAVMTIALLISSCLPFMHVLHVGNSSKGPAHTRLNLFGSLCCRTCRHEQARRSGQAARLASTQPRWRRPRRAAHRPHKT